MTPLLRLGLTRDVTGGQPARLSMGWLVVVLPLPWWFSGLMMLMLMLMLMLMMELVLLFIAIGADPVLLASFKSSCSHHDRVVSVYLI
jgi:hypothetical protein